MSVTDRHPLGLSVLRGDGEVAGGVVDQNADRPERRVRPRRTPRRSSRAAARPSPRPARAPPTAVDRLDAGCAVRLVAAGDRDAGAEAAELDGHRLAESGAAAGDQHDLAGERARRQHRRAERGWLRNAHGADTGTVVRRTWSMHWACHGRRRHRSRSTDRIATVTLQPARSPERLELGDGDGAARSAWRRSRRNRDVARRAAQATAAPSAPASTSSPTCASGSSGARRPRRCSTTTSATAARTVARASSRRFRSR